MSLLIILSFSIIEPKHLVSPSFSFVTHLPVYLFFATVISFLEKKKKKKKQKEKKKKVLVSYSYCSFLYSRLIDSSNHPCYRS